MQRSIPEDDNLQQKMVPKQSGFTNPDRLKNLKNTAVSRRLKGKVLQAKNGTAHEQHMAHVQHMQHVRNVTNNNMKSKNPYNK